MSNVLEINNLKKQFGKFEAVRDVSLNLKEGELFALIGPNGSGKTTIIKTIVGLLKATSGSIEVNGVNVDSNPVQTKSLTGYVPDEPQVWNRLTGEEFLNLVGVLYGTDENSRTEKIKKLLDIYGLKGIEKGYFQNYSRGNKQKFTFLAALLHNPKLLLIDEPIVGLDPKSISITKEEMKKYIKKGGTIFMATHVLSIAEEVATKIGVLDKGKLVKTGTIDELRNEAGLKSNANLEDIYLKLTE